MSKPSIFFSHSSKDESVLERIKEKLLQKTGNSIDIFLSSDGQSIPLGHNWVHKIENALESANLVLAFLSPNSLQSLWVPFEAGFVYSKKISVIPIGILGIDLQKLPPPFSLLQGFNITSEDGLNNIIAIINRTFSYQHDESFTKKEYDYILDKDTKNLAGPFSTFESIINDFEIKLSHESVINENIESFTNRILTVLDDKKLQFQKGYYRWGIGDVICTHGIKFTMQYNSYPAETFINVEPSIASFALGLLDEIMKDVINDKHEPINIELTFNHNITHEKELQKISSRFFETDILLGPDEYYTWNNLFFKFDNNSMIESSFTKIFILYQGNTFGEIDFALFIKKLFDYRVLFINDEKYKINFNS